MARLAYGDLIGINFTISGTSRPDTTQTPLLITLYYQKCYNYLYGPGNYSADESTDDKNIIDTEDFRAELNALVSHKVQLWNEAGKNADGSVRPMPKMDLYYKNTDAFVRRQFTDFLDTLLETNESREYIDNVRLWGSDYSDRSGVFY
jgi:hypothetical protein